MHLEQEEWNLLFQFRGAVLNANILSRFVLHLVYCICRDYSFEIIMGTIELLKSALDWNDNYEGKGNSYGEGFELTIQYKDIHVESIGKFAFPDNYQEVHREVLHWLNQVLEQVLE